MGENNTPTALKGCGVKTGVTVDVSLKNALPTFLFGESRDELCDLVGESRDQLRELVRRTRDWLTGYDIRGRVLLAGRSADALNAEKPGPVSSSSQPAVHSNQFPGHPLPLLPTQGPGPQGWD